MRVFLYVGACFMLTRNEYQNFERETTIRKKQNIFLKKKLYKNG